MTYTLAAPPAVAAYLHELEEQLADFPGDERAEILDDVETSLLELDDPSDAALVARFGTPQAFATELRDAAGVVPKRSLHRPSPRALQRRLAAALASQRTKAAWHSLQRLAPIWWAARAYLLVAGTALVLDVRWSFYHPYLPRIGGAAGTAFLLAAALALSLAAGIALHDRRVTLPFDLVAAIALVPVLVHLSHGVPRPVEYITVPPPPPVAGLNVSGLPVTNIYPYSRDGVLLHDVLLYDQQGRPLDVGSTPEADPDRRVLRTPRGTAIMNSFPIRYYDPMSANVAHPNAGPAVRVPKIATPPVRRPR